MHPNPAFRAEGDLLGAAAAIGFAHIVVAAPESAAAPTVVHAPVTRHGERLRFHVARANRIAAYLDGAAVLVSVAGEQGYISPAWYAGGTNQVPTWNYRAIEVEGWCAAIGAALLVEQLDALAAAHEPRVNPAAPWTRAKMDEAAFRAMLRGIRGFELTPTAIRATAKLSQNKSAADRDGAIAGLRRSGEAALAAAMAAALTRD